MKSPSLRLAVISVAIWLAFLSTAQAGEWWVALDGADKNPGTREAPFATVGAALRRARELRRINDASILDGARIIVRGGTYRLAEPLFLRPEDSGSPTSPTTIEAAPGERPTFSGGVPVTGWRRPSAPLPGLPAAAQSQVWVAPLPSFAGRDLDARALWVGDRKAIRARNPNDGTLSQVKEWNRSDEVAGVDAALVPGTDRLDGMEMVVQQQWEIGVVRVKGGSTQDGVTRLTFHGPESRLEFEHPWPQPILPPEGAGAFFLANRIEFLDTPGEWYLDRETRQVIYWPQPGEDLTQLPVVLPALETLVRITGSLEHPVHDVSFRGIEFRHTTWMRPSLAGHVPLQLGMFIIDSYKISPKGTPDSRGLDNQTWIGRPPAAVEVQSAHHLTFEACRFVQLAMDGLDLFEAVQDSRVEKNLFRDIGGNGLVLGHFSDTATETHLPWDPKDERVLCSRVRVANNLISDAANEDWGCAGIAVGYAQSIAIEHNEIRDVSYTGISVGWGWTRTLNAARGHRIYANLMHHIATRMCDTAGVYTLSAQPGTEIVENVVHSIKMSPFVDRPEHWFYLYLDEGSAFIRVKDNWCPEERFLKNANGPGNIWENNGPQVAEEIKARAGLEPGARELLER